MNRRDLALWAMLAFLAGGLQAAEPITDAKRPPIRAFCIDFNWGPGGPNAFAAPGVWADADPEAHVAWYEGLGANVIQTFAVSCNGYAWYKGGPVPPQPKLKHDFLTEVVRLGHRGKMRVMGYFCVGANTRWGLANPTLSYGAPSHWHIPFTTEYLDFLAASIADALTRTGMDGFMIDWVFNTSGRWLDCEKPMYRELMGKPFPGKDKITPALKLEFDRRAIDRCWGRIRDAARKANPKCVIWLSCHDLRNPVVVNSRLFREVDWLMNEAPDPAAVEAVRKMAGPRTRLVQCLVGWGDRHDARRVLLDPRFGKSGIGVYGFARPRPSSFPGPIALYRAKPISAFSGNDRNIAVLLRHWHGLPLVQAVDQAPDGSITLGPADVQIHGRTPIVMEGQIGHWADGKDWLSWTVKLTRGGRFDVVVEQAVETGGAGQAYTVRIADTALKAATVETGTWRNYIRKTIGQVEITRPGQYTLELHPAAPVAWKPMSLKSIRLHPSSQH